MHSDDNSLENCNAFVSRCSSISTIDSTIAAELVKQYENQCTDEENHKLEKDAMPQKMNANQMTFDKSEGIHVGDIINYYYQSPSFELSQNPPNSSNNSQTKIIDNEHKQKQYLFTRFNRKLIVTVIIIFIIILSIIGGIIFTIYDKNQSADMEGNESTTIMTSSTSVTYPTSTETLSTTTTTTSEKITTSTTLELTTPSVITLKSYVKRDQWNADPPLAIIYLKLPINRIIIAHTGGESCTNDCKIIIKELQDNSTHLDDIPFNFLIGDDLKIYEGRGIEVEGQHTANRDATEYNSIGICIAFIGNYQNNAVSESQIEVYNEFIEYFIEHGVISENYTIYAQDQLVLSDKSADKLNDAIKSWKGYRNLQKIYHREEWEAESAKKVENLNHTANWTLITSTMEEKCLNFSHCVSFVQNLQTIAFNESLNDIPFAFVISNDGLIFEGRGWDLIGQHTEGYDDKTVAICVIGYYGVVTPNQSIINAIQNLFKDAVALGKLTSDYDVNGRQELGLRFQGPGGDFVRVIKTWSHWKFLGLPK